jgi:hypothetical protein
MSILIKGMEMPKNCLVCQCTDSEYGECVLDPEKRVPTDYKQIAEWCPLVPVPPHGRLIDADAFISFIRENWDGYDQWFAEMLEARPTIIPAEEGEK